MRCTARPTAQASWWSVAEASRWFRGCRPSRHPALTRSGAEARASAHTRWRLWHTPREKQRRASCAKPVHAAPAIRAAPVAAKARRGCVGAHKRPPPLPPRHGGFRSPAASRHAPRAQRAVSASGPGRAHGGLAGPGIIERAAQPSRTNKPPSLSRAPPRESCRAPASGPPTSRPKNRAVVGGLKSAARWPAPENKQPQKQQQQQQQRRAPIHSRSRVTRGSSALRVASPLRAMKPRSAPDSACGPAG